MPDFPLTAANIAAASLGDTFDGGAYELVIHANGVRSADPVAETGGLNVVNNATGIHLVNSHRPPTNDEIDPAVEIVTGHDLTKYTNGYIELHVNDATNGHKWAPQRIDIDALLNNPGSTNDASSTLFDNDFLQINLVDAATGTITINDNGRALRYIRSDLFSYSQIVSRRVGMIERGPTGRTPDEGYLAMVGVVTNGAIDYPIAAQRNPLLVSGDDLDFTKYAGVFDRNLGGNAGAEGVLQPEMVGPHTHPYTDRRGTGFVSRGTSGNVARSGNFATDDRTTSANSGTENRPANIASQWYLIVDTYLDATGGSPAESCIEATSQLLPTTFTFTGGAQAGGGNIVLGAAGQVGGFAERLFPVTNIGKKHTLSFDHFFNGNAGQQTLFDFEVEEGGRVIATGSLEANSPTAITHTADFYPTGDVIVRFKDMNPAGGGPSSDIRVTSVSIEATCTPFVGDNWIKEDCYEEAQAPVPVLFTGTDYADDNSATALGVTSTVSLTGPLTLAANGAGDGGTLSPGDAIKVTTTTTNVDGTAILTFDSPTDVTLGVERLNGNEIVNFITPIDSMVLGDAFNQAGVGPQAYSGSGNQRNEFTFVGATQIEWTHSGPATGFVLYDVNAEVSPDAIKHIVRTNENDTLLEVDRVANTLTALASIPATWTLCLDEGNQPTGLSHTRQVFDWVPNNLNVRNGFFKITDDVQMTGHLPHLTIEKGETKTFYIFGQGYSNDTQNTLPNFIGIAISVTEQNGGLTYADSLQSKFTGSAGLADFPALSFADLVSNGGPASMSQEQFDFFVKPQIAILETSKNDLFRDLETWTPTGSLAPLEEVDSLGRKVVRLTDNGSFAYLGLTENGNTTLARTVCIEVALDSAANQSFLLRRAAAPSTVSDFIIDLSDGTTTVFATNGATVPVVESSNVTDTTAEYFVTFGPEQFDEWQLFPAVGPSGIVNQGGYDGNLTGFADILALDLNCAPAPTIDGLSLPLGITVGGAVVCDYYTDDGGFQMQHRNSTATIQIFKTTIPGVAWAEIPNLQANLFTLRTIDNGDNTYDHVFSGHLPPNSSIRILGDAPVGAGLGNNGQGQLIIESKSAFGQ